MVLAFKISNLKFLICVLSILASLHVFAIKPENIIRICKGQGLNYTSKDDPSSTENSIAWQWKFEGGDIASSSSQNTAPVTYDIAGTFKTYLEISFPTLPIQYDTFLIIVQDFPIPPFYFPSDTSYCTGSQFSLTLSSTNFPNVDYEWNTGATTPSININLQGTYWVKSVIHGAFGSCDSVYKEVVVTEVPIPVVNLGSDQLMCQNQIIVLDAKGGTGYRYAWSPSGATTRQISVSLPGIYSVVVSSPENCQATDQVELIDSCPHLIFMPDVVSPNDDLLNDFFDKTWNFTPKEYTYQIYNRWGQLIFSTNDMKKGWDCKVNDTVVQQDVYIYKITYLDTDKKWYEFRGTFFVVR